MMTETPPYLKLTGKLEHPTNGHTVYIQVPLAEVVAGDEYGDGEHFIRANPDETGFRLTIFMGHPQKPLLTELASIIFYNLVSSMQSVALSKVMESLGFEPDDLPSKEQIEKALERKL